MMPEHIKKGYRANPKGLKQLGFQRLSSTTWVKDKVKVQVLGKRISSIRSQVNFNQPINDFSSRNSRCESTARQVIKCLR
jgi:hypothetical protein